MSLDLDKIKKELEILPEFDEQIALQGTKDNLDPFYPCGPEIFNNTGRREHEFDTPIFDMPYTNSIIHYLKMYRTRVMILKPRTCYTYHKDTTKRIHIPLVTNDKCFFIINIHLLIILVKVHWLFFFPMILPSLMGFVPF